MWPCSPVPTIETPPTELTAAVDGAEATFERLGNRATIRIATELPGVEASLHGSTLPEAVQECCDREIEQTRTAFRSLIEHFLEDLPPGDDSPDIDHSASWHEARDWHVEPGRLRIDPASSETVATVDLANPVSDAGTVRTAIENELHTREQAIREVYQAILQDVQRSPLRQLPASPEQASSA